MRLPSVTLPPSGILTFYLLDLRSCSIAPDVRVVYMSGYMHGEVSWAGLPGSVVGFLKKPIELEHLLATVRQVLSEPLPPESAMATPERC